MELRFKLAASMVAMATLAAAGARADTLFSRDVTPEFATDQSATAGFMSAGGPGTASFILDGYATLDGQNFFEDDFTLSLNGSPVLSGTFDLGGGGGDVVFFAPAGSSITNAFANVTMVTSASGQVFVTTPLSLIQGLNSLAFTYISLPQPAHAGFQGLGDEGWGLENLQVSGAAAPEPASWSLLLLGFGGLGAILRHRRQATGLLPS